MRSQCLIAALGLVLAMPATAAPPAAEDVGDPESFGRSVTYLGGILSGGLILLGPSCAGADLGPDDYCFEIAPGNALTSFDAKDLGRMRLPAKSTKTILFPLITPNWTFQFNNTGAATVPNARFHVIPYLTLESEALNDPALANPQTGQPFNGKLDLDFAPRVWDRSLAAGERSRQTVTYTRAGIGGISTGVLRENFGLSDNTIDKIFKGPITVRTNVRGNARYVDEAVLFFGLRVTGD